MGKKIAKMAAELYEDPDLANAVVDHAVELGTVDDIEAGRKVLPHPEDAERWHEARQAEIDRRKGEELRRQQQTNPPAGTVESTAR